MQAAWNTFLAVLVFILASKLACGGWQESGEGCSVSRGMDDGINVYTVVGAIMIFLLLMGDGYGLGPL